MNKYLEKVAEITKVALNAAKARAMAREVGVIPDTDTAWKYALRKLRDSKGMPLTGRNLQDARVSLGDVSNNGYQKLRSYATRGVAPDTEISAVIDRRSGDVVEKAMGKTRSGMAPNLYDSNLHSHPYEYNRNASYRKLHSTTTGRDPDTAYRVGYASRIASPSGFGHTIASTKVLRERFGGDIQKATSIRKSQYRDGIRVQPDDHIDKALDWNIGGDISTFSNRVLEGYSPIGSRETIIAPHVGTVSSTRMKVLSNKKIVLNGKRSAPVTIYFDHSPRKTR